MQTTHKIAGASASGYAAYLTSASDRGDYYLTSAGTGGGGASGEGDGDAGSGAQSRWHGSRQLLDRLGLNPGGPVGRDELLDLMNGVSPVTGEELRRAGANGLRVAGIDLTFSAPKSVSALWAVSGPGEREVIERAHREAVASTIGRIEREVELVRGRVEGEVRHERARSVVAGEFVHTSSRLTRDQEQEGVPDPQLHSHVVVLGAERVDGRYAAVDSRPLVFGCAGERCVVSGGARARTARAGVGGRRSDGKGWALFRGGGRAQGPQRAVVCQVGRYRACGGEVPRALPPRPASPASWAI